MYNGHGDVTNLLDGKGGIIGSYYYDAFGNVQENTSTFSNPYRYAGYQYDEEIGKYYLLNRMYDPESARFMQEDTYRGNANDPLSLNLYTYVNNNPMIYDDQNGHWPSFIDNFFSSAKSVVSNTWGAIKETASYVGSKILSAISPAIDYISNTNVGKAVSSVINKGKKTLNTIKSTYNAVNIVYNKVIKPKVERDDQQKLQELKTGIVVKAGEVASYVKGLDMQKLAFGGMSMVVGAVGAVAGGAAMLMPGGQVAGAALIGLGLTTVAFGAGEVRETLSGVNPVKNLAMDNLKISESNYYFAGGVIEAGSGLLTGNLAALALAGSIMDLSERESTALAIPGGGSIKNNRTYSFMDRGGSNKGINEIVEETTRVRHYTNRKGINGIEQDGSIIAKDNNRVYVELASKKPLSQVEAETKYQIKTGKGRDYVEFDVPNSKLEWVKNPRYGTPELTIKGGIEELLNPKFVRRK
ncbi:hypothetical protein CSC2_49820 [Clostridium zeae]|uniref:Tox-ART-HYD1 domain-containing protein n=1 Tax=Clostridium zeae TaxID=2759022 RepID=A0ABQ1EI09_9CLOT|nr:RHS repeat-associated core domain-containing protein [Clostridium zeae]GFZ34456.1 hypothetical protein CSC2_49820 [Clostridium zeae]